MKKHLTTVSILLIVLALSLGAVLLLSDGRQTAGDDPVPALRALRATASAAAWTMFACQSPIAAIFAVSTAWPKT